jgi:hypothetical protein
MSKAALQVLRADMDLTTDTFFLLYKTWAEKDTNPHKILSQFEVLCVMHNKLPESPEHEFLIIETIDKQNKRKLFILERTIQTAYKSS